jgi:protein-disulfide isomerase
VERFRRFREQPTPELERSARQGLRTAISPNDRLQQLFHPWTSYVIVPLFAVANAGIAINSDFLAEAVSSPITIGVFVGYVVGKPVGIVGVSWLVTRLSHGRLRPPVGWAAVTAGGTIAGIGFTVALLIASLAFAGTELQEAKLGILAAAAGASIVTWVTFWVTDRLPDLRRDRALLGSPDLLTDLAAEVDPDRDHIRGPRDGGVTLVEYGDFECPYCGRAEPVVRALLGEFTDIRYVWRHLPLSDVHRHAQLAAEAAEAASDQGAFWEMHDTLLDHQDALETEDLVRYAEQLGLDTDRFSEYLDDQRGANRIADDVDGADRVRERCDVVGAVVASTVDEEGRGAGDAAEVRAAGARARVAAG